MMGVSRVRLVSCPNCENPLPDDFYVDHCARCGALLQGKPGRVIDKLSEKLQDQSGMKEFENGAVVLASSSKSGSENDDVASNKVKGRIFPERANNLVNSSSSRVENREILANYESQGGDSMGSRIDQRSKFGYSDDTRMRRSRAPMEYDLDINMGSYDYDSIDIANKLEEIRRRLEIIGYRPDLDQRSAERIASTSINGIRTTEQQKFAYFSYPSEKISNDGLGFSYGYGEHLNNRDGLDGLVKVESLENERAELLEKLNDLKDQVNRSYSATEHPEVRINADGEIVQPPLDLHSTQEPSKPESATSLYDYDDIQHPPRDKHSTRPSAAVQNHVPFSPGQSYDVHAPSHVLYENLQYEDVYQPKVIRRPPAHQLLNQYLPRAYEDHSNGQYTDFNQDPPTLLPHEAFSHHRECSCYHCYNNKRKVSQKVPPPLYGNYYQHGSSVKNGSLDSNLRNLAPPLQSQGRQRHILSLSDLELEHGIYVQNRPRRLLIGQAGRRVFLPIAGGAPIITCCNCFELLKLPRKLMLVENKQQKLQCGACSTVFLLKLMGKCIVISVAVQSNQDSEVGDSSAEMLDENIPGSHSLLPSFASEDYDGSGYDNHLTAEESNLLLNDQNSNSAEIRHESCLSSSSFSEDEQHQDSVITQSAVLDSVELPSKDDVLSPLPDLPLQEHHDNSSKNAVSRDGKVHKSKRSYVKRLIHRLINSQENSVKDVAVATETDVSSDAYLTSGVTRDSTGREIIEEDQYKTNNRNAGLMKNRSRDSSNSSQSGENETENVYVNGQLIPYRAVKKAEKLAGTIQPGDYWYDFQAGFWGVMGYPCVGIIPPYIKEFNYPLPENCSDGNTSVFVNGRELSKKDLDKLSGRGLPVTEDKSYIIKFSGKVRDADTSEELKSLGKLAPSVLKARRGFGMKIPKTLLNDSDN